MTRAARRALATMTLMLAGWLGACAGATELALPALTPARDDAIGDRADAGSGGAMFAGLELRERREAVFAGLAHDPRRTAEPRCTVARVAPADGSRRAYPLERCEHVLIGDGADAPRLADRPVRVLVTHFVDERLVRVDAVVVPLAGEDVATTLAAMRAQLDERLGARAPSGERDRWALGGEIVELAREPEELIRLTLTDGEALALLPMLGEDRPVGTAD